MASTFMAMGNGMGISADMGKKMAKTLTGLAGDMASFYNVSQDVAQTALNSIYTGETESLKKFGVVMTEANLQQYAYSKGITKQVSAMSQLEKVYLRYSYVLNSTKNAQGDFARTSGSWANQMRLLKEQFSQLLGILGKGLISVLKPIVKALNTMLASLISIVNSMSKAFGGKGIEKTASTVSSSVEDMNSQVDDTAGGFDQANKEAKKLERTLAGFDELNVLDAPSDTDTTGNQTELDGSAFGISDIVETDEQESPATKLQQDLDKCAQVLDAWGQKITEKINEWKEKLPKLDISIDTDLLADNLLNVGNAFIECFGNILGYAIQFGVDLANSIDFDAVITNLSDAMVSLLSIIETIGTTIFSLLDKIQQDLNLGYLIELITGVVASLMNLIDTIMNILAPAIETFYDIALSPIVEWIGEKLADALLFIKDLIDDWSKWFEENGPLIQEFIKNLAELVNKAWQIVEPILNFLWELVKTAIGGISELLQDLFTFILEHQDVIFGVLNTALDVVGFVFNGILSIIEGVYNSICSIVDGIVSAVSKAIEAIQKLFSSSKKGGSEINVTGDFNASKARSIQYNSNPVPQLASGGVIDRPTVAMMGEYAGASNNPEIVSPVSILKQTFENANNPMLNLILSAISRVDDTIKNKDMDVYMDATKVSRKVTKEQKALNKNAGKSLVIV